MFLNRSMLSQNMKNKLIFTALILLLIAGVAFLKINYYWPFSTGTHVPAFLSAAFEMSQPEAQRALRKNKIQLVDHSTFLKVTPDYLIKKPLFFSDIITEIGFDSLFLKDQIYKDTKYMYLPPVNMFKSAVIGEFCFIKNKLSHVEIKIFPIAKVQAKSIAKEIVTELEKKYNLVEVLTYDPAYSTKDKIVSYSFERKTTKQDALENSKLYNFKFNGKQSTNIILTVDFTAQYDPKISLFIKYNKLDMKLHQEIIKRRESTAF